MTIKEVNERIENLKSEIAALEQVKETMKPKWIVAISDTNDARVIINLGALPSEIKKDIIKAIVEEQTWFSLTPYGGWGTTGLDADGGLKYYSNTKVIFPINEINAENEG